MPTPIPAFISYSAEESEHGHAVKALLRKFGIDGFLAHDDLAVSEEWRARILDELLRCEVFVALLSNSFRASDWCAQEVGVVIGRDNVAIVPLSLDGTTPFGFLSQLQAKRVPESGITEALLIEPIARKHPHKIIPGMIGRVRIAGGFRIAEAAMASIIPFFPVLNDEELQSLVQASIANYEVWAASRCAGEYLPQLIEMHRARISAELLRALEYQITEHSWYKTPS